MRRVFMRLLLAAAFVAAIPAFGQNYNTEAISSLPSSDVPKVLQDALQPSGVRFLDGSGKALAEIWLAKAISGRATPDTSMDIACGSIVPGAFAGVVHFPNGESDFRGQNIKSGYFSLRYDLIPQDGNHMGVSQYRDFLLLVPVAQDPDPAKPLKMEDVVKLSREVTGTGHPGVLVMDSLDQAPSQFPSAFKDFLDNWALAMKTQVKPEGGDAKDQTMLIVLVGKYEG
jgi:hypothetical protein